MLSAVLGSSVIGSSGSSAGSSIADAGSSIVDTGSSVVGSSTKEVIGSSADVLGTLGSNETSGILHLTYTAMDTADRAGNFINDLFGWIPFF